MLREALEAPLCVVSGGLGPTHDDRTVELVARSRACRSSCAPSSRPRSRPSRGRSPRRRGRDYVEFEPGVRKQATLPRARLARARRHGARVRAADGAGARRRPPGPARGAAPALAAGARDGGVPGAAGAHARRPGGGRCASSASASRRSPRRSRRAAATATASRRRSARATSRSTSTSLVAPGGEERAAALEDALARELERVPLLARRASGRADRARSLRARRASRSRTAESCTGGLVAALLTALPGSSAVFVGGSSSYANEREGATRSACRRSCSPRTARSRPRSRAAMARRCARRARRRRRGVRHGRRRAGRRQRGEAGRARVLPRGGAVGRGGAADRGGRPTARRCASGRRRARSISCGALLEQNRHSSV